MSSQRQAALDAADAAADASSAWTDATCGIVQDQLPGGRVVAIRSTLGSHVVEERVNVDVLASLRVRHAKHLDATLGAPRDAAARTREHARFLSRALVVLRRCALPPPRARAPVPDESSL